MFRGTGPQVTQLKSQNRSRRETKLAVYAVTTGESPVRVAQTQAQREAPGPRLRAWGASTAPHPKTGRGWLPGRTGKRPLPLPGHPAEAAEPHVEGRRWLSAASRPA